MFDFCASDFYLRLGDVKDLKERGGGCGRGEKGGRGEGRRNG